MPETINQKVCRLLLSVHKKSFRLAVLGELGRYPYLIKALSQCLKYEWSLVNNTAPSSVIGGALKEMELQASQGVTNWLSNVRKIRELFSIADIPNHISPSSVGVKLSKDLKANFDRFFLDQINQTKLGNDGLDHNKLRFYKKLKGSFTPEPYTELVKNRNQRVWLSRIRTSAHHLRIETGWWTRPNPTSLADRTCLYCQEGVIDNECHFLLGSPTVANQTRCFVGKISSLNSSFFHMSESDKVATILCPTSAKAAKITNKFVSILFNARERIDLGEHSSNLTFPPNIDSYTDGDLNISDCSNPDVNVSRLSFLSDDMSVTDSD